MDEDEALAVGRECAQYSMPSRGEMAAAVLVGMVADRDEALMKIAGALVVANSRLALLEGRP